jgi:hypothetical protein
MMAHFPVAKNISLSSGLSSGYCASPSSRSAVMGTFQLCRGRYRKHRLQQLAERLRLRHAALG